MVILFLIVGLWVLWDTVRDTKRVKAFLVPRKTRFQVLPKVVTSLLVCAQLSELLRMVEQTNIVTIVTALVMLAILLASRSGSEDETYGPL